MRAMDEGRGTMDEGLPLRSQTQKPFGVDGTRGDGRGFVSWRSRIKRGLTPVIGAFLMGPAYAADELRDVKPPVLPEAFPWGSVLLALVLTAAVVAGLFLWYSHFRHRRRPEVMLTSWELALKELAELEGSGYLQKEYLAKFYVRLSDILRRYLEGRFGIRAPGMTTEEFLTFAQSSSSLRAEQKVMLRQCLIASDMVKFAKHAPDVSEARESLVQVRAFVGETMPETGTTDEGR